MVGIGGCRFDAGGKNYRKEPVHVRTGVSTHTHVQACAHTPAAEGMFFLLAHSAKITVNPTDAF